MAKREATSANGRNRRRETLKQELGEVIELPVDCLKNPHPLDIEIVAAYMTWPKNLAWRNSTIDTAIAAWGQRRIPDMDLGSRLDFHLFALEAMPPAVIRAAAKTPRDRGPIAGIFTKHLVEQVILNPRSEEASADWIINDLSNRVWPKVRLKPNTIKNWVLPIFRKVSHLWAAYVAFDNFDPRCFPCELSHLGNFLSLAEWYRTEGEKRSTWQSPTPILPIGECVRLPAGLHVPKFALPPT